MKYGLNVRPRDDDDDDDDDVDDKVAPLTSLDAQRKNQNRTFSNFI